MNRRIAKFEKVSFEQFLKDQADKYNIYNVTDASGNLFTKEEVNMIQKMIWNDIKLPIRSTSGSAGYDICSTINAVVNPGEAVIINTGLRCFIDEGWCFVCMPRSGHGFKYEIMLANTLGLIDEDYSNSDNEGHIMLKLVNRGNKPFSFKEGDHIAQGVFLPYGLTKDDAADGIRNGGFGSTDN